MGKGSKRRPGKNYEKNYEAIFGKKKAQTFYKRYGRRARDKRSGVHVVQDIEPFRSPITGEIISSRSQLRQHNKEHGVTDSRDYSPEYYQKKAQERIEKLHGKSADDQRNRIEIMRELLN